MSELGGPTTQSGILYQNTLAALYLGRLCDASPYPPHEQIVEVRCEAPTKVDDIVLTFADGHYEFIQAKEALEPSGKLWEQLWQNFAHQFLEGSFRPECDKLVLFVGDYHKEWRALRSMSERSEGNACFEEWHIRLSQETQRLFARIQAILETERLDLEKQRALFGCFRLEQKSLDDLELSAHRDLPRCDVRPVTLFRLLRDRIGTHARRRKPFYREDVLASLQSEHAITFECSLSSNAAEFQDLLAFMPGNQSRLQLFVSSRLQNDCLRAERDAIIATIAETQLIVPWAWERENLAGNYAYEATCLHFAAQSDGLVLIVAGEVSSLCRKEYDAAASAKKPCYIFIKEGSFFDPNTDIFIEEQRKKGNNPIRFRNLDELKSLLGRSLQVECVRKFRHSNQLLLSTASVQARLL